MAKTGNVAKIEPNFPDPERLASVWMSVFKNGIDALQSATARGMEKTLPLPYDPTAAIRALNSFTATLFSNPVQIFNAQRKFSQEWRELWAGAIARAFGHDREPVITSERGDRRFNDPAWTELPAYEYLKQAYLLTSRQILELISESDLKPEDRTRVDFYTRQFLNAIAPTNFALSNPEAMQAAMTTGGVSLLAGLANMLDDAASPHALVKRRSQDDFEVGVNIAATPGGIIFRNELMELIQYQASTDTVYKRPVLYVPPLVNKYYILDLQPKSSLVKWLVDQGHTVFVVSWVNPGPELAEKGISDYIMGGPIAALDAIARATGETTVDAFAFCMGGVLLSMTAGYLAAAKQAGRLGSLTIIGTLLDSTHSGEWSTFYEPEHFEALERHVDTAGVIKAEQLQSLFSIVRANDLIWSSVVNHYLLDRVAPPSDLLFWFADGANIPKAFILEYGRVMLKENSLRKPGGVAVAGKPVDLSKIKIPVCVISLKDDHVSSWQATYAGAKLFGGKTRFLLGGSGHNAGLVNPPSANKHGYWTNENLPETAESWLAGAQQKQGSWWPEWQKWLVAGNGGEQVPARIPGSGALRVIEAAPGSYVRMKSGV